MITLIHDLVVDVSQNNYTLLLDKHKQDKNGKEVYETIGYYSNLKGAVCGARDYYTRKQLETDVYTLDQAIKTIKEIGEEFLELLNGGINEKDCSGLAVQTAEEKAHCIG